MAPSWGERQFQLTSSQAIKACVEEFWKDQINDMITNDSALEEFYNPREEDEAFQKLQGYLYDKLLYFDFTEDEVTSLAEFADIQGQIEANQEAASHEQHEYELLRDERGYSVQSDDSQINDLFERDLPNSNK